MFDTNVHKSEYIDNGNGQRVWRLYGKNHQHPGQMKPELEIVAKVFLRFGLDLETFNLEIIAEISRTRKFNVNTQCLYVKYLIII